MHRIAGRRYDTGEPVEIGISGDRISNVRPLLSDHPWQELPWVAPGLFDLQINGHGGTWFCQEGLHADDVTTALEAHFQHGITRICPTLITNSHSALCAGFEAIRAACESERWVQDMVAGCHLEGPYISLQDGPRGAHPKQHVRQPDWDEFQKLQDTSGQRIRLLTLAPESPGAPEFIRRVVESGVVVAIGHTAATSDEIHAAADAGATLSTHLGNGAHGTLRRHPNYIWDQLGDPRLMASIITDGHHLPDSVVRAIVAAKSPHQTIITCDAAGLAGCPPGVYHEATMDVEILTDGRIVLAGQEQLLAGSSLTTDVCVSRAARSGAVDLKTAIDMASLNPARLLGCEQTRLLRGLKADLFCFTQSPLGQLSVIATIASGVLRYGNLPN
ncbi:MAG: amidohydrolase family protein [Planctomycetaceae bacterium]